MKGEYTSLSFPRYDFNSVQSGVSMPVQGYNKATIQVLTNSVAVGSLVLTIRKSLDNQNWTDVSTTSTLGVSSTIDVTGYAFLGVFVTTALGAACVGSIIMYAEYI